MCLLGSAICGQGKLFEVQNLEVPNVLSVCSLKFGVRRDYLGSDISSMSLSKP